MTEKRSNSKDSAQADSSLRQPAPRSFSDGGGFGGRAGRELRKRAEKKAKTDEAKIREMLSPKEIRRTLHELRVHQIELEMQNEELRRAQAELDAARARYFDLYDLAPVGYCTVSEQGLILEANLTAATLRGVARGALVNQPLTHFILPEDQDIYYRLRKHLFETGAPQVCELRLVKKDGDPFWAHLEATAAKDADGDPMCRVVLSDITARKRAEEAIHRKAKELQEKNDELNRFTYAVSHDLRSPLVTIRTFQGQLEQDLRSQDAARIEMDLGYIRNAADKMSRLLDELLRLSRVGRMMNPSEEAPLQAVVKEALDLVAGRITARGVRVDLTEEPVVVTGDRTRLVEVFMNLVDNAAKFMGDQPAPRVEIGVEQVGEELALFVRDNGIGIDPRLQPMLFGLFHKLDPGSEGTGIGLALVRRIVEVHGGRIWVESEGPGKGTTFRFTLAKTRRGVGREERT